MRREQVSVTTLLRREQVSVTTLLRREQVFDNITAP